MTNSEIINLLQRITGIFALGLLALQIYLGANRKAIKLHMLNGILAYTFVFLHPILFLLFRYFTIGKLDPLYVFVDVCVLCQGIYEHYINLGRIGFYLVTVAVIAVKFRNISGWLKTNWRKLHILNYLAFYFVSFHSIFIGTDSRKPLFLFYFILLQIVVLGSIVNKLKTSNLIGEIKKILGQ
jgi:predicted ferric reductase